MSAQSTKPQQCIQATLLQIIAQARQETPTGEKSFDAMHMVLDALEAITLANPDGNAIIQLNTMLGNLSGRFLGELDEETRPAMSMNIITGFATSMNAGLEAATKPDPLVTMFIDEKSGEPIEGYVLR